MSPGGSFWITLPFYLLSGSFWGPFALLGLHFDCLLVPLGPSRGGVPGGSFWGPFALPGVLGIHFGLWVLFWPSLLFLLFLAIPCYSKLFLAVLNYSLLSLAIPSYSLLFLAILNYFLLFLASPSYS